MAKIIELPKLSPTMEEGTLVRWARNEGDAVQIDDLLAEVETDKATMEFRAFDSGTLLKQLVAAGATAKLGQPVAIFGAPGEDIQPVLASLGQRDAKGTSSPSTPSPETTAKPAVEPIAVQAPAVRAEPRESSIASNTVASTPGVAGLILAAPKRAVAASEPGRTSPRIRRIARERGIAIENVSGSGPEGRVTLQDLSRRGSETSVANVVSSSSARPESVIRAPSSMRKTIARRLTESKREVPHFYLEADLDVEALGVLREQLNEGVEKDARVSVTDLLIRASALALKAVPTANASWTEAGIAEHRRCDISVAVAVEDGLLTPVIRDADQKSVRVISAELKSLAARAREKKLKPEEMQGGVFSISNLGMFSIDRFSAVINPPESMILAVGSTREVPVVKAGAIVPGKRCAVTLSCDHRVVDGALGARWLQALRALVERPIQILA